MKKIILFLVLVSSGLVLTAQPSDHQPEVRYNETRFFRHDFFTIGDSVVTEQELAFYFKITDPEAYEAFNFGLELDRKRQLVQGVGIAGVAAGLLSSNRTVDRIGYSGLVLSGLVAIGFEMWAARKKGTGLYLYNSKRSWRKPDPWAPPAPKQFERDKPYSVIESGGN